MMTVILKRVFAINQGAAERAREDLLALPGCLAAYVLRPEAGGTGWRTVGLFPDRPGVLSKSEGRVDLSQGECRKLGITGRAVRKRSRDAYIESRLQYLRDNGLIA